MQTEPQTALDPQPSPPETETQNSNLKTQTSPIPPLGPPACLETHNSQLITHNSSGVPAVIQAQPLPATNNRQRRRNGRIASLPKLQRDMVNHMLSNGVPYKNIVAALDEAGFKVVERNISNWATGGYLEWRFEQDLVLQNRLDQDHLVDHLRRDDASELPEVGLQAAATRVSQILVQKAARADDLEANLGSFSQMVDVLCRLNREISVSQKQRDESRRTLGPAYDPARIKEEEQMSAINNERFYSNPPSDSGLAKPALPPALPPIPTSSALADADCEAALRKELEKQEHFLATLRAFSGKKAPAPLCGAGVPPVSSPGVPPGAATLRANEPTARPPTPEAAR